MIAQEPDPDVMRWGLHHLVEGCAMTNDSSHSVITRFDQDSGQVGYVTEGFQEPVNSGYVSGNHHDQGYQIPLNNGYPRECYLEPTRCYTENDALIARVLQEEYSQASGALNYSPNNAYLDQNWRDLSRSTHASGFENGKISSNDSIAKAREEDTSSKSCAYDVNDYIRKEEPLNSLKKTNEEQFSSENGTKEEPHHDPRKSTNEERSSSFGSDGKSDIPEDFVHDIKITDDDSVYDVEMGKRLNQMVPVPHVPKINGQIPTADEEVSDHQRLLDRLMLYELVENKVQGDGNCQFRALSDQLYRTSDHHRFVREQLVKQLQSHPQVYEGYVPMGYAEYLKKMSKNGEWGDHVTLQAAADWFGVKIFVITSFKDTCYIEIIPHELKSIRVIFLSFWAEVHYNSIYPAEELPLLEKKKKKWWMLGN
ncbi:hypothetical protein ACFE04_009146 [Oxalis oulophora]